MKHTFVVAGMLLLAGMLGFGHRAVGASAAWTTQPNAGVVACVGCWGTSSEFNNSTCIVVTWNPPIGCADGTCQGQYPNCNGSPCTMAGTMEVTNNCLATIYVRKKSGGGTCLPGTTPVGPGASHSESFDGDALECNAALLIRVYVTDPGNSCPTAAAAGGTWVCSECWQPY